jgi:hypothetical protein
VEMGIQETMTGTGPAKQTTSLLAEPKLHTTKRVFFTPLFLTTLASRCQAFSRRFISKVLVVLALSKKSP